MPRLPGGNAPGAVEVLAPKPSALENQMEFFAKFSGLVLTANGLKSNRLRISVLEDGVYYLDQNSDIKIERRKYDEIIG